MLREVPLPPKGLAGYLKSVKSVFGNDVILDLSIVKQVLKRHPETAKLRDLKEGISLAVASPDFVFAGRYGENIAARKIEDGAFEGKWMMVPYKEGGRVKTAFIVSDVEKIIRRRGCAMEVLIKKTSQNRPKELESRSNEKINFDRRI